LGRGSSGIRLRKDDPGEIIEWIVDWAAGEELARTWYRFEPVPAFGGRAAEIQAREGRSAARVNDLDYVAAGGVA
jgi:hypothetical protein